MFNQIVRPESFGTRLRSDLHRTVVQCIIVRLCAQQGTRNLWGARDVADRARACCWVCLLACYDTQLATPQYR